MRVWSLFFAVGSLALASGCADDTEPAVDAAGTATDLSLGAHHACVIRSDGQVKCWGHALHNQLGLSDGKNRGDLPGGMGDALPSVQLGSGRHATAISASSSHTCAVLDDGQLKCWGTGFEGQLGLGSMHHTGITPEEMGDALPAVDLGRGALTVAVSAAREHTCALLDSGSVKCWGELLFGRLGLGMTYGGPHGLSIGDGPGEMGDALPTVDLGTGKTAVAIATGDEHTCALLNDARVKCWGNASLTGTGSLHDIGHDPDGMGDALPPIDLGRGRTVTAIAAGGMHTCALLDDGTVKCWGVNNDGQLGLGDTEQRTRTRDMGDALPRVDLGTGKAAIAITAGSSHTCALLHDRSVKCWGYDNGTGCLGVGASGQIGDEPGEMGDALLAVDLGKGKKAVQIQAGVAHTCARLDDDTVKCWGRNDSGQLGLGDTNARGTTTSQMGDNLPAVSF
ncbi:RCC1 domain-containing protein [Chondromyces crocatus]|uniref:Chromosome condensation regulator RCC1 n=1 Tax=Chondromyces crocatus TaxID=52 RepID=A0A0K1EFF2_CHOCO|nr:hypothetical protein [Chondromyces crocatus]AKT39591.1 uncharacterized protein CMC5_037400 [Chondromyces crocatus]